MRKGFILGIMVEKSLIWVWGSWVWSRDMSSLLYGQLYLKLLIFACQLLFVDLEQANRIRKGNIQVPKVIQL